MSSFDDAAADKELADTAARIAQVRQERDRAVNEAGRLRAEIERLRATLDVLDQVAAAQPHPPKWMTPAKPKDHHATGIVMLSDCHFDEVVNPTELHGLNGYNRDIATMRLERTARNMIKVSRDYLQGLTWDGLVVILGGDLMSGEIHEELTQTNAAPIIDGLLYWSEQLAACIDLWADTFRRVHVVSVPGNHGRTTRKPRAKQRAATNFDYLLSHMVSRTFRDRPSVTFDIPEAMDATFTTYSHLHLVTHGDQATGGSGIGGIWPPIMRLRARKLAQATAAGRPWSYAWMGHWHQYVPTLTVNGALKGYDEYAMAQGFPFEPPSQAFAVATPEHGVTFHAPIFSQDRKKEGW